MQIREREREKERKRGEREMFFLFYQRLLFLLYQSWNREREREREMFFLFTKVNLSRERERQTECVRENAKCYSFSTKVKMSRKRVLFSCIPDKVFRHFHWDKKFPPYTRGYKTTLTTWLNTRAPACVQEYWATSRPNLLVSFYALLTLQSECSIFRDHAVHWGKSTFIECRTRSNCANAPVE